MARSESASPTPEDGTIHPSFDYTDGSELSDQGELNEPVRGAPKSGDAKDKPKVKKVNGEGQNDASGSAEGTTRSGRRLEQRSYIAPLDDDDEDDDDDDDELGDDEDDEDDDNSEEDLEIQVGDVDDDELEDDDDDSDDDEEDDDEDEDDEDDDDDEDEEEDGDQDDSDNESVKSGQSVHLSSKQKGELGAWIKFSQDPPPDVEDADDRCKELYGYSISEHDKNDIEEYVVERILNGPPLKRDRLMVPGFGLPIIYKVKSPEERAPFLLGLEDEDWEAVTLTNREVCMLKFIEDITNKPSWWKKVRDPRIAKKWKEEVVKMPWTQYRKYGDFTEQMADVAIEELLKKADLYEETGLIPIFDYSACVIKSDSLMTDEMAAALKAAVAPLEKVEESLKDWHPGSDNQVLDLVHPSLCPLVYGLSRVVPEKRIPLSDCLEYCGSGVTVPVPEVPEVPRTSWDTENYLDSHALSRRFQWLPCDVELSGDKPRIDSYINNLHPVEHKALYPVIEQFIEKSLPAWDLVWRWPEEFQTQRIVVGDIEHKCKVPDICGDYCSMTNRPGYEDNEDAEDAEELNEQWWDSTHDLVVPDADSEMEEVVQVDAKEVLSTGFFDNATRAQVIVKLANIHLTPENPKYKGGSWHVEGQYNEHICATALYYYDTENITDCYLDFRTQADEEELSQELSYAQGEFHPIEQLFDIDAEGHKLQTIGSVLTREGRAVFFPNVYQHHVSPFELADKTKPGHRKILALFLIDPQVPVLSTANVPPQQQAWWDLSKAPILGKLPPELMESVKRNVEFPIGTDAAKKLRLELMEERKAKLNDTDTHFKNMEWGFCEH